MLSNSVLLVEDDPVLTSLIQNVLASHGYQVLCAADATEALRVWESAGRTIPVALVDITLPGPLDGMQLAQRLRADAPSLRLVITSGRLLWPEPDTLGQSDVLFLQKPFLPHELLRVIRRALHDTQAGAP